MAKGKLTTHVLDLETGFPAAGLNIDLSRDGALIASVSTNADGRVDAPLLGADTMQAGTYELLFHAGAYQKSKSSHEAANFLDQIPIRFIIDDEDRHYHVPLLLSPYGYSTYRGS